MTHACKQHPCRHRFCRGKPFQKNPKEWWSNGFQWIRKIGLKVSKLCKKKGSYYNWRTGFKEQKEEYNVKKRHTFDGRSKKRSMPSLRKRHRTRQRSIGQLRTYVLARTCERKNLLRKEIQENIRIEQDENETLQKRKSALGENEISRKIAALHEETSVKCLYSSKYDLGRSLMRRSGTRQNILTTDERKQDEYFIAFFAIAVVTLSAIFGSMLSAIGARMAKIDRGLKNFDKCNCF